MWKLWHKHQIPAEFRDYDSVSGRTAPPTQLCLLPLSLAHIHMWTHTHADTHQHSPVLGAHLNCAACIFQGNFLYYFLPFFCLLLSAIVLLFELNVAYIMQNQTIVTTPKCLWQCGWLSKMVDCWKGVRKHKVELLINRSFSFVCLSEWMCVNLKATQLPFVCMCLLLIVQGCAEALSTASQATGSPSIWNINAETRLAMPSQASCSLPIDFSSVRSPPSKSREGSLLRARTPLLLSQAPTGLGLLTDPALLISTETVEGL